MKGVLRLVSAGALVAGLATSVATGAASAQELKIGFVDSQRILRDSAPARAATQKLELEFKKRDQDLQDMGAKLKAAADKLEKDGPVISEGDRNKRQRELGEMDREFQKRQREFREDLNQRRNEELQVLVERAQKVVKEIAVRENYDLIVQDAVHWSARVDITEKVLRALNNGK